MIVPWCHAAATASTSTAALDRDPVDGPHEDRESAMWWSGRQQASDRPARPDPTPEPTAFQRWLPYVSVTGFGGPLVRRQGSPVRASISTRRPVGVRPELGRPGSSTTSVAGARPVSVSSPAPWGRAARNCPQLRHPVQRTVSSEGSANGPSRPPHPGGGRRRGLTSSSWRAGRSPATVQARDPAARE
jgi:hypothetical protein